MLYFKNSKKSKNSFKYHKNFKKTNRCEDIVHMFSFVIRCERDKIPFNIVCPVFPDLGFFVSLFCEKFLFFHRTFFLVITMCA